MNFTKSTLTLAVSLALLSASFSSFNVNANDEAKTTPSNTEIITVTSDFRSQSLAEVPTSIAIIDQQQILDDGNQHLAQTISRVANINFSGGSSRPKYFQIRGVGERSEYRGAPNSSVGFIIDDIDISGLGMAATMFDVQQVEILRGPQGTRFGANALAGLIYIKSNDPTTEFEHGIQTSFGDDELITFSGYSSGPITDNLSYRAVLQQHQQNGYRDNRYLQRNDTNNLDELTGKFKLRYVANNNLIINFTYLDADLDNGFDVWTLDNNGYDTLTDVPGVDTQRSKASSLKIDYTHFESFQLTSITSFSKTDHHNAFDGDWANPSFWGERQCDGSACVYDFLWEKRADRKHLSQEFRFSSTEQSQLFANTTQWLTGIYFSELDENNAIDSSFNGWTDEDVDAQYNAKNIAAFIQLDTQLNDDYQLSTGLRIESRQADYVDSLGDAFSPSETMWGGHLALSKSLSLLTSAYVRIARGYKAGGFNMGLPLDLQQYKEFETETLINYEIGIKSYSSDHSVTTNMSVFYMDRQDQQVNASVQNPDEPQRFIIYTANATSSSSYGLEFDTNWQINNEIALYATLGYLKATYKQYDYQDKYGSTIDISGRELAHAPNLSYSTGIIYRHDIGLFTNLNMSGKSDFYFSDSHAEKSQSTNIINAIVGYEADSWSIYLWARNLTDEKVATRGFYFGNEPDLDWENKKYLRYDAPRHVGVTLDYQF